MRTGPHIAEHYHGVPHDVHDVGVADRDRISHRWQVAVEEDVVMITGKRRPTDHAPDDGHVIPRLHDSASRFHDLDARGRPAGDEARYV
jgi:hypothetical protein